MSEINLEEMRKILKTFTQNLPIISTLYPDKALNLSQISQQIGWDGGTMTNAVKALIANRFIIVKQEIPGPGKAQKVLSLTELSIKLYSVITHYFKDSYAQRGMSDKSLVDEYFNMLKSNDPEVRQQAADGLHNESTKNVLPLEEYLLQLEKMIFDPDYLTLRRVLLQTLDNIAKNSDDSNKRTLEEIFRKKLEALFNDRGEGTNVSEHARILALSVLSEVADPHTRFQLLMECYLKLLEEGSVQALPSRSLIISKYPDRLTDFKLVLLKKFSSSTGEYRQRIGEELKQL